MTKKIAIIGAGVNGLSCGALLLDRGWDVTIITKHDPSKPSSDPAFSSKYPAASVIPHSVNTQNLAVLFSNSQQYFSELYNQHFPGLQKHTHFELFGESMQMNLPDYKGLMMDFSQWDEFSGDFYPSHPNIPITNGWRFSCFFADWTVYYPALLQEVISMGGKLEIKSLSPEDLKNLPFDIIINCSGLGSIELFGDEQKLIHRGHLLHLQNAPPIQNETGELISYNFTPGKNYYQSEGGHLQDVYFYPADQGWIFGGSRQEGTYIKNEPWIGEQTAEPKNELNGSSYPAQIYNLNADILKHTFNIEPADYSNRFLKIGYRYTRSTENGLRLESEVHDNKLIIHNYGNGGSGVTLSWGCALEVCRILQKTLS